MTTSMETALRERLRTMADVAGPPSLADRSLVRAARMRRRRNALVGVGAVALATAVAVPVFGDSMGTAPGVGTTLGTDTTPSSTSGNGGCRTVTDESDPVRGVPKTEWPDFVSITVAHLPARDDYTLQSGYGVCPAPGPGSGATGEIRDDKAYAVINLGPNREDGHVTVTLGHRSVVTCAALSGDEQVPPIFCDESTPTTPLVYGLDSGGNSIQVTAIYADTRTVRMESNQSPIDANALKAVVTAPPLADLID
jgi:hypothetical protein